MELFINEENLKLDEVQEFSTKVRALLFDEYNRILIANYGNVILLPGGKVDKGEENFTAIVRELSEELGEIYSSEELDYFMTLNYFQKDYPKRDGTLQNRLVQTHYFIGKYKEIKNNRQKLTEKEKKDNFKLELVLLNELENIILNNKNDNPRNIYFQRELLMILDNYRSYSRCYGIKKIKQK